MARYVQHVSGQGEKWKVYDSNFDQSSDWKVESKEDPGRIGSCHYLPKSEYRLCEPPERWEDVTESCEFIERWPSEKYSESGGLCAHANEKKMIWTPAIHQHIDHAQGYRLRKVQLWTVQPSTNIIGEAQWAFVVEKKES